MYHSATISGPKLSIRNDMACLTFEDVTTARVVSAVRRHIAKSGEPQNRSGVYKVGQGFNATFGQKLYYKLGAK